jgi:hypothetical protein
MRKLDFQTYIHHTSICSVFRSKPEKGIQDNRLTTASPASIGKHRLEREDVNTSKKLPECGELPHSSDTYE